MATSNQRFGCYVGNIDASVPLETIRQVFAQCGSILDCSLNGRDTDPYRFGFIDFGCEADRERALKFNGVVLAGRPLKVGVSKGNVNRPTDHAQGGGGGGRHHNDAGIAESTALLVQLVQSGAVNPANLTPEQQRLLSGALLGQLAGGTGMMQPQQQQQQQAPPPMMQPMGMAPQHGGGMMGQMGGGMMGQMPPQGGGYGGMGGGYQQQQQGGGRGGFQGGRGGGYRQGPPSANPAPSEELVMLRQAQRKTFFDVVRKDADKYQEKLQKKKSRRDGSRSESDGSSSSGGDDRRSRRRERTKERRVEPRREDSKDRRDGSAPRRDDDSRNAL